MDVAFYRRSINIITEVYVMCEKLIRNLLQLTLILGI